MLNLMLMLTLLKRTQQPIRFSINLPTNWFDGLYPIRQWLNELDIYNATFARLICWLIPAQCPFARDLRLLGRTLLRIPPLCKLNPFYEEVVNLRLRALCYLANECGEDVRKYC
jgi:hypothetical protein